MNNLVQNVCVITTDFSRSYVFQVSLSALELQKLSEDSILCGLYQFQKPKYKYLSDLADVLSDSILKELEKL